MAGKTKIHTKTHQWDNARAKNKSNGDSRFLKRRYYFEYKEGCLAEHEK